MQTPEKLSSQFNHVKQLSFYTLGEHTAIKIKNNIATCDLTLFGAHILSYTPTHSNDLLWMSPSALFTKQMPIRGGIPICFPWFGPHNTDKTQRAHGFARLMQWELKTVLESDNLTTLTLELISSEITKKLWPFDFKAIYKIEIGNTLNAALTVKNTGDSGLSYTLGLHTYFNIGDIEQVSIGGLQNKEYYQAYNPILNTQKEEYLSITQEENRRYLNCCKAAYINDKSLKRTIVANKAGSRVTVVWNPYLEDCKNFKDIPDDGYVSFVCIEATNTYDNTIELHSGHQHTTSIIISEKFE